MVVHRQPVEHQAGGVPVEIAGRHDVLHVEVEDHVEIPVVVHVLEVGHERPVPPRRHRRLVTLPVTDGNGFRVDRGRIERVRGEDGHRQFALLLRVHRVGITPRLDVDHDLDGPLAEGGRQRQPIRPM